MAKYLGSDGLVFMWSRLKTLTGNKVDKELKTGSTSQYKVLSDNNLTDALVTKIRNAGSGTFTGSYEDLTEVPSEFPPSVHQHEAADVSGLAEFVDGRLESVSETTAEVQNELQELWTALENNENLEAAMTEQLALKANSADIESISNEDIDSICI